MKVLCVGAGLMGSQIGVEYALNGHSVTFLVNRLPVASHRIEAALGVAEKHRLATEDEVAAAANRISSVQSLSDTNRDFDVAVESIPEDFEVKVQSLSAVARDVPSAIIATNTSSLSIGELGTAIGAADRTVGTHYLNPPLLTSLVEVAAGPNSSADSIDLITSTLRDMRKRPVMVEREVTGFLWNRLQFALLREALWLVQTGVADADTVDVVVQLGLAQRWRQVPPLKSVTLGGVETFVKVASIILPTLNDARRLDGLRSVSEIGEDEGSELIAIRDQALAEDRRRDLGIQ